MLDIIRNTYSIVYACEAVLEDICDRLGLPGGIRHGGDRKISDEELKVAHFR